MSVPYEKRAAGDKGRSPVRTWAFWRNLAVYFCVFSIVGHWLEVAYCIVMRHSFGIYDPDSLVWVDLLYPFIVYGFGVVVCALVLLPLKKAVDKRVLSPRRSLALCFAANVLVCLIMELVMGFLLNRQLSDGRYPLWDNSELPLSIFGQAWLLNDLVLGAIATLYVWVIYPFSERALSKIAPPVLNMVSVLVVFGFVTLCVLKFQT
jgi:uncharacterized membrane protein